jgi:hypothetical protein
MLSADEDTLRDLIHRCTDNLLPPASIVAGVVARERRRRIRRRTLSIATTGAAIGTAAGVTLGVAAAPRHFPPAARTSHPAITLTAEQRTLYRLSAAAAAQAQAQGRYAVLSEKQDSDWKTSIIDSLTGDTYAYQKGPSGPNGTMPVARHWSPTQAQFNAMPTGLAALRALLIAQYDEQFKPSQALISGLRKPQPQPQPREAAGKESDAGKVFQQATSMLWNPLVIPQLRAALFRLLATTPGVKVDNQAKDSLGRSAVEISWTDPLDGVTYATYENPTTTAVLEQTYTYPPALGPGGFDLYLSTTRTSTIPPDPYGG